jgi:nitrate reductase molybdenum cofactor assembly chaperone NarJ/NarW
VSRLTDSDLSATWQSASLLLDYPDAGLVETLPLLDRVVAGLPREVGDPLRRTTTALSAADLPELECAYVETFDTTRRNSLFLTYFAHGDTRKRGMALLRFRQTYRASGHEDSPTELPDHLCVVLEYAATIDGPGGRQLLLDHRAGLEVLRLSLADTGSPWAGAVEAVCATLPPLRGDETEAIRRLAAEGPPDEEVGLAPYAAGGPTPLPMPSFPAPVGRGR